MPEADNNPKPTNEHSLLCERCGYVLDDLDPSGICPECAMPIELSQPRLRPGSPWQAHPSPGSMIRTWWLLFRHPKLCWDEFRVQRRSGVSLLSLGLIVGASLPAITILGILTYGAFQSNDLSVFGGALVLVLIFTVVYVIVAMIYAGLAVSRMKFWARHRGYRIDSRIAWTIIGHASLGLVVIPVLFCAAILDMLVMVLLIEIEDELGMELTLVQILLSIIGYILTLACIPIGLIVFEVLSSLGMRRMRYRNPHPDELPTPNPPTDPQEPIVVT